MARWPIANAFMFASALSMICPLEAQDNLAKKDAPTANQTIPVRLGSVDAVSGAVRLQVPMGPRLPGRIPVGFQWSFDSSDTAVNTAPYCLLGRIKPVIWPGGTYTPAKVTVWVLGEAWTFYPGAVPATGSMPTSAEIQGWISQRHVDDGTAEAQYVDMNGGSGTLYLSAPMASSDGTKFYVESFRQVKVNVTGKVTNYNLGYLQWPGGSEGPVQCFHWDKELQLAGTELQHLRQGDGEGPRRQGDP